MNASSSVPTTIRIHHELSRPSKSSADWMVPKISTPSGEPLMREPERIEAMGARARAVVASRFSRDREADEISAVYRQVWGARKG